MPLTAIKETYKKYERWVPIASFLAGFMFDMAVLKRIDEPKVIIQQAIYLLVSAFLIGLELIEQVREIHPPRGLGKIWKYREAVLHFLLGTLLNSYTIFYFKSASALSSMTFIIILISVLTINEFKHFGKSQTKVHIAFLSLCLVSYLTSLAPTLMGFIGTVPFLCAIGVSFLFYGGFFFFMKSRLASKPEVLLSHLVIPFVAIQTLFIVLYFLHLIPPVPLSVKYMGIFHATEKVGAQYELSYARPEWKFWQHGDQDFLARPGDVIYCYTQIFSPGRFKDQLQVRWLYWEPRKGWSTSDLIPLPVSGGREEGYRAVTKKSKYQPGEWRVQIETLDAREIGSIDFNVEPDSEQNEREFHKIIKD
jgi:hypothetical protein